MIYRCVCLAAVLTICVATGVGDDRRPPREVQSDNGRFVLRIEPGKPGRGESRPCTATLAARDGERGEGRTKWERPLVNDVAPGAAAVRDDGRFVVTLDEFRRGGARNALVIYGERGQLLRHFVLTDLLTRADWRHVERSQRSLDWLDDARVGFEAPDRFFIELKWDREIVIDLKALRVLREGEEAHAGAGDVPPEILAALTGDDDRDARIAALAERMGTTPEKVELLLAEGFINPEKLDEIALALAQEDETSEALDPTEVAAAETLTPSDAASNEAQAIDAIPPTAEQVAATELDRAAAVDSPHPAPAESNAASVMVPQPNPAEPVDYLQWLNAMAVTAGPNAAPEFQAAIDARVEFAGDAALLAAAERGDATALQSPEIAAYLAANEKALAHLRNAGALEFQGWQIESADGSMIGALLPALAPLRQLGKTAVLDGMRRAAEGDYEGAADRYLDALTAGAQTGRGPTLIENLVGVAVQNLAAENLLDLPAQAADAQIDFVNLATRVETAYQPPRTMDESVQFERAAMLESVQRVFELDPSTGKLRVNPEKAGVLMSFADDDDALTRFKKMAELSQLDFDDTLQEANTYYDALAEGLRLPYPEARSYLSELENQASSNALLKLLTPALSRAHFAKTRAESQRRASLLVTNLMAYRQQHGSLPDSLDAFNAREFVSDPFTGQRFTYRRDGDSFVLYSLGGNGQDDGGAHDGKAETNDVVYWPRPARN